MLEFIILSADVIEHVMLFDQNLLIFLAGFKEGVVLCLQLGV